jgi:hypothetical protein
VIDFVKRQMHHASIFMDAALYIEGHYTLSALL